LSLKLTCNDNREKLKSKNYKDLSSQKSCQNNYLIFSIFSLAVKKQLM